MLLVDEGDYDGDGKEEAFFKVRRYDHDGCVLCHEGFGRRAEFGWSHQ